MEEKAIVVCEIAHPLHLTVSCTNPLEVLLNKYEKNEDTEER